MLFEQAAYEYVNEKQFGRKSVRPNTLEGYLSAIKCHLMPQWSGREIESITSDEMQAWVDGFELFITARATECRYCPLTTQTLNHCCVDLFLATNDICFGVGAIDSATTSQAVPLIVQLAYKPIVQSPLCSQK